MAPGTKSDCPVKVVFEELVDGQWRLLSPYKCEWIAHHRVKRRAWDWARHRWRGPGFRWPQVRWRALPAGHLFSPEGVTV